MLQDKKRSKTALKAKLRSLRYRQKTLNPRRTALQDIMHRLEVHMSSPQGVTTDDYMVRPSSLCMHAHGWRSASECSRRWVCCALSNCNPLGPKSSRNQATCMTVI